MPRPVGLPKTGGRKAGTPNKSTQSLVEKCEAKGLDVFGAMVELALEHHGAERFKMLAELAQYILPKRKAMEVELDVRNMTDEELAREVERRLSDIQQGLISGAESKR